MAFVPCTPMLVPEVASGAAHELADVRSAAEEAVRAVLASSPQRVVIVGAGERTAEHRTGTGSLLGFGVEVDVALDPRTPDDAPLPLSLTIGAWLLARTGWHGERAALEVDPLAASSELARLGRSIGETGGSTALVVVADGSASRTDKAPASFHPESESFDSDVAAALASGEAHRLASIDRDRAVAVASQGWPAWYVASAAAGMAHLDAELRSDSAPYGVGYFVATWIRT